MHSHVTITNVSWPHFSWPTVYLRLVNGHNLATSAYLRKKYVQDSDSGSLLSGGYWFCVASLTLHSPDVAAFDTPAHAQSVTG